MKIEPVSRIWNSQSIISLLNQHFHKRDNELACVQ